jgi:hypothetical protein
MLTAEFTVHCLGLRSEFCMRSWGLEFGVLLTSVFCILSYLRLPVRRWISRWGKGSSMSRSRNA